MNLTFHEYAGFFPLIEGAALDDLPESIRSQGVVNPIVLYEGQVLDGRNRHLCATDLAVECPTVTYDGDDPLGHAVALNLESRRLTKSQRVMLAARLVDMSRGVRND